MGSEITNWIVDQQALLVWPGCGAGEEGSDLISSLFMNAAI